MSDKAIVDMSTGELWNKILDQEKEIEQLEAFIRKICICKNEIPLYIREDAQKVIERKDDIADWELKYIDICEKKDVVNDTLKTICELRNQLIDEHKALKEFIKSMATQFQVMVKKL